MVFIDPVAIVVDFLRNRLTDPRDRAEDSTTDSFVATSGQTSFTLSPPSGRMSCIQDVQVDSVSVTKWEDYYIDFKNDKVIFFSGQTLSADVDIQYKYGETNWIFPDKPNKKLSETAFPRMNLLIVTASGNRLGETAADVESAISFQLDVWTKEKQDDQIFTIGGNKYTGEDLAKYLAYQVQQAFEDNESDLHPALYAYTPTQFPARDLPFNAEYQAHHKSAEFILKGINVGRIT